MIALDAYEVGRNHASFFRGVSGITSERKGYSLETCENNCQLTVVFSDGHLICIHEIAVNVVHELRR